MHSNRHFPTFVMNDGAIVFRDMSPRSRGVTFDFLRRSIDLHREINEVDSLAFFWGIADQVRFWKSGYRVVQIGPREYIRWSLGPKEYAYEERSMTGEVLRLPFMRVILGDGYPAPSELRFPSENAWDKRV